MEGHQLVSGPYNQITAKDDEFITKRYLSSPEAGQILSKSIKTSGGTTILQTPTTTTTASTALTSNLNLYLRPDGKDTNDGSANNPSAAWLTFQHAINEILKINFGIYTVTLNVANGTYIGECNINGPYITEGYIGTGIPPFRIIGNTTIPSSVVVNGTYGFTTNAILPGVYISGLNFTTTGNALDVNQKSRVWLGINDYGTCTGYYHLKCSTNSFIYQYTNCTISGNAASHMYCEQNSEILSSGNTTTFSGIPAFSTSFVNASDIGLIQIFGVTFSGSATGIRYIANASSIIDVGASGMDYIPGNAPGRCFNGSKYVTSAGTMDPGGGDYYPAITGTQLATAILADSPLAFWKCDDTGANFVDSSGNSHTVAILNPVDDGGSGSTIRVHSKIIPTVAEAIAQHYNTGAGSPTADGMGLTYPYTGDFTFECVAVIPVQLSGLFGIMSLVGGNTEAEADNFQLSLRIANNRFFYTHEYGLGTNEDIAFKISHLALHGPKHILLTRISSTKTLNLYLNGTLADTRTYTNAPTGGANSKFYISGGVALGQNGIILGYAAFYTSALASARIIAHASATGLLLRG